MKTTLERWKESKLGQLFFNKKFAHYTWIGIFISLLNIFLLWLMIDIMGIPTVVASSSVVVITFFLRYFLFDRFKIL